MAQAVEWAAVQKLAAEVGIVVVASFGSTIDSVVLVFEEPLAESRLLS